MVYMYGAVVFLLYVLVKGECEMAYKALAVANAFIKKALEAENPPTQMKLQKLIFYAHGWCLGLKGEPLIDEKFEAWPYGPVVPAVYHTFKTYGRTPISAEGTEIVFSDLKISCVAPELKADEFATALIDKIWIVYGEFSGTQLSELTHKDGTPWSIVAKNYGGDPPRDVIIPNELIENFFKKKKSSN